MTRISLGTADYPRNMRELLGADLDEIFKHGVWAAFPTLAGLRGWQPYIDAGGGADQAQGTRIINSLLKSALTDWKTTEPFDAEAMSVLLDLDNYRRRRVLNGVDGLRTRAGSVYNVGWDQFRRKYETGLIGAFAGFLLTWKSAPATTDEPIIQLTFDDLERAARELHRTLEQQFRPDLVITMSGPGSFAACYMMQFNPRDVPVVMAVTFPWRPTKTALEREFARAAHASEGLHIATTKWSVYLPSLVRHLPSGFRIALVDDRVLTGDSQLMVRRELEGLGHQVSCAALFCTSGSKIPDLIVGRTIKGSFQMPWGTARGRR